MTERFRYVGLPQVVPEKKSNNSVTPGTWWGRLVIGRLRSDLEQDTEPQIAPCVQLAPCMVASAISEGPCDDLSRVYPALAQRRLGLAPATNPATPWKRDKAFTDHDVTWQAPDPMCLDSAHFTLSCCKIAAVQLCTPHTQECISLFKVAYLGSPLHCLSCPYALLLKWWYRRLWLLQDQIQFLRNPLIWCGDGFLLIPSQRALLALCKPSATHQKMQLRCALCDLIHLNKLNLCFRSDAALPLFHMRPHTAPRTASTCSSLFIILQINICRRPTC